MKVIKYFSPLLKEKELVDDLPVIIRVKKFDEAAANEFCTKMYERNKNGFLEELLTITFPIDIIGKKFHLGS